MTPKEIGQWAEAFVRDLVGGEEIWNGIGDLRVEGLLVEVKATTRRRWQFSDRQLRADGFTLIQFEGEVSERNIRRLLFIDGDVLRAAVDAGVSKKTVQRGESGFIFHAETLLLWCRANVCCKTVRVGKYLSLVIKNEPRKA